MDLDALLSATRKAHHFKLDGLLAARALSLHMSSDFSDALSASVASGITALQPHIARHILALRDQRVMLDADLAALYGVETKVLVQAVKRNSERFPGDFMFQLDAQA